MAFGSILQNLSILMYNPQMVKILNTDNIEEQIQGVAIQCLHSISPNTCLIRGYLHCWTRWHCLQCPYIHHRKRFSSSRSTTYPANRDFWEEQLCFTLVGIVYLDKCVVIPFKLRKEILENLHSAHQGVTNMKKSANTSVYWPGMSHSITNFCANCLLWGKWPNSPTTSMAISTSLCRLFCTQLACQISQQLHHWMPSDVLYLWCTRWVL